MKKVKRSEIMGIAEYESVREPFRRRMIEEKRRRRIVPCDEVSVVFENHDTVLLQIQEMLRTERISREDGILHEMETYNALVPGDHELSATLFVEIPDAERRERRLVELAGLERHMGLEIDGNLVRACGEARGVLPDRTTAVHYIRLPLGQELASRLRQMATGAENRPVAWILDHPKLTVRAPLPREVVQSISEDLDEGN